MQNLNELNIDYLIAINIEGNSGKEKGSKEKAKKLKEKGKSVRIFSLDVQESRSIRKILAIIGLEFKYFFSGYRDKKKPDVIFTRSMMSFGSWLYGKIYNIPVIREVHADFADEADVLFSERKYLLPFMKLFHKYYLFFLKRSDGIIFNNQLLEDHFIEKYGIDKTKTVTIHNGCDTERFYPIEKDIARNKLSLPAEKKYLLFIGSLSKWHGVHFLLKMQKEINKFRDDIVLLIVGGKIPEINYLKKTYSAENINFIGRVEYEKALLFINACDISLIPVNDVRVSPGSPIKLFDSISCGKPVIAQEDTPGYSDLTEHYSLGGTCNFKDPEESSHKVINFIDTMDNEFYKKNNRDIAENKLEWSCMIDRWIKFAHRISKN